MRRTRSRSDFEKGQALVLVALAFVGLAAFIGLVTDAGIVFSSVGALRRAVDSSALSASNQFREGNALSDIAASARQFMKVNLPQYDPSLDPPGSPCDPDALDCVAVRVFTCENDASLCSSGTPKKLVRVEADMRVNLAFLPIIGYDWTVITANAISEAGSVDLVLVIDTSPSMAYDLCTDTDSNKDPIDNDLDSVANADDCPAFGTMAPSPPNDGIPESDVERCRMSGPPLACEPFETVREDAKDLVRRMYFPYDRVSIIGFARTSCSPDPLKLPGCRAALDLQDAEYGCHTKATPAAQESCVLARLDDLEVELEPDPAVDCPAWFNPPPNNDPSGCTSTNTGDALALAGNQFANFGREDAIWVVILLSDGVANAATRPGTPPWVCPPSTWTDPPYCQDGDPGPAAPPIAAPRPSSDPAYDADDHARQMALFVGCPNEVVPSPDPTSPNPCTAPGNQAVIFTIGLGDAVVSYDRGGVPEVGGELLQFISAVSDGTPWEDPCGGLIGPDTDCGNYYFVEDVSELAAVFDEIASLIYTKLNH